MASTSGPEAEFHDPHRQKLLQALNDALPADIRPTAWACLWLCDINKLQDILALAQARTTLPYVRSLFEAAEVSARVVPTWTQRKRLASIASTSQNTSTPQEISSPQQPTDPIQLSPTQQQSRGQKRNSSGQLLSTTQQPDTPPQLHLVQQQFSTPRSRRQIRNSSGQLISTRSKVQRDLCHQRDQMKCVLTKAGEPNEVAHIYPFSMRYEDDSNQRHKLSFWEILRMFWSEERVDAWYNAIFPQGPEVCQNLICLSPNAHAYWERAYFALKPIRLSDDKKHLDIQFFWLSSNPYVTSVNVLNIPSLSANSDQGPNLTKLFDHENDIKIHSGCEMFLETDDPVSRPLPDFRLLEMQWFLHRVTAMSGAAELQDDFHDSSDSDYDFEEALMEYNWNMNAEEEEEPATNLKTSAERF